MRSVTIPLALAVILSAAALAHAQDKKIDYEGELRNGDAYLQHQQYQQALQAYERAYALTDKTSYDALVGIGLAYRNLGAYKEVLDLCADGLKLAGDDKAHQAQMHNLRGSALVELADKPGDKKLKDAEAEFRTALAANPSLVAARLNLGIVLLKTNRDDQGLAELKAYLDQAPNAPSVGYARLLVEDPRRARERFAPAFSFTSREGDTIALEQLKGRTVLLDFWGSWCGPCVQATPELVKLRRKFIGQPVSFVSIARDEEPKWKSYLDRHPMDWPQYLDADNRVMRLFAIEGFPTYIVLDGEGIIRARVTGHGSGTAGWIEREIKKLLKNP